MRAEDPDHARGGTKGRVRRRRTVRAEETADAFPALFRKRKAGGNAVWNVRISLSDYKTDACGFSLRFSARTAIPDGNKRF